MNNSVKQVAEFTDVYSEYYPLVMCSVYKRVNNYDEAEDITQEVFMRLYQKIEGVDEPRKWIFGTLRLVTMEYYRKKGRNDEDIENYMNDFSINYINGFKDVRIIIEELLETEEVFIDTQDRTLFEMVAMNGFTLKKASKIAGYTYDKARYRYTKTTENIVHHLKLKGIKSMEDLL